MADTNREPSQRVLSPALGSAAETETAKETRSSGRADEVDSPKAGKPRGAWRGRFTMAMGMLVAIVGGAGMGAAAVMVASGRPLGLLELYASLAITAVVARLVYRRGGMFSLCVYAALAGMATALGPALMG